MIKVLGFIDRRSDFSVAGFSQYWRTTHVLEALKLKAFIARYVQNHFWSTPLDGLKRPADGCPELWYETPEALAAMSQSDAYKTGAYIDEPRFMEGRARGVALRETVVLPEPQAPAIKVMFLYNPAANLTIADFERRHQDHAKPLMLQAPRAIGHIRSHALPSRDAPLYAGADEVWWATQAEFEADWQDRHAPPDFIDMATSAGCRVDELRVF